jgi:hypothetical protein
MLTDHDRHAALASAWLRYSTPAGRATDYDVQLLMRELSADDLARMLVAHGVTEREALQRATADLSQAHDTFGAGLTR